MILMQAMIENMKFIVCILMIIRILVQERMYMAKETDSNIVFGIMEMILADCGWKKKKSRIAAAIKENVLFQQTNIN